MIEGPVPIPSASVPAGAVGWSSGDAWEWVRARPAGWARPLWAVLAVLASLVWAFAVEPVPVCSEAVPCGPDWGGMAQLGLAVGLVYWTARGSDLVLVAAPLLAVSVGLTEVPGADAASAVANLGVIAAVGLCWAGARERVAARRRQRELALRAAGEARHPLPASVMPLRRGTVLIAVGATLCGLAVWAVGMGLGGIRADERRADAAIAVEAEVVARHDLSLRVRLDGTRTVIVDALFPEHYPVGGTVTVLEDGTWRRLVAEPYDAFDWQLLVLVAGLPGLSLLGSGLLARRRAVALRRAPVPALRVLERLGEDGLVRVYAADDVAGSDPVLVCDRVFAVRVAGPGEPVVADPRAVEPRLREAVLFGTPHDGGELVLVTTGAPPHPVRVRGHARARAGAPAPWGSR
ncbi:hypothetical protein [Streptomyces sp. NPDC059515]|uniref:hypothetical protein n=1 Tax=Streptomyces sp. NPDC059515 TaxID=3346854 RepID=UPI00367A78B0